MFRKQFIAAGLSLLLFSQGGCQGKKGAEESGVKEGEMKSSVEELTLISPAFDVGAAIPVRYTCDGEDVSPPLKWNDPPGSTTAFALVCDDPDAPMGTWVHWVIYDIPPSARGLGEGVPQYGELEDGSRQGRNDFKHIGYDGPCPPPGKPHRYFFKLYALDTPTGLEAGADKKKLLKAIKGHILAEGQLMGKYKRR